MTEPCSHPRHRYDGQSDDCRRDDPAAVVGDDPSLRFDDPSLRFDDPSLCFMTNLLCFMTNLLLFFRHSKNAIGCVRLHLVVSGERFRVGRGPENMETVAVISFRFSSSGRAANSSTFRANKSASALRCSSSGTTACSSEPLRSGDSGGVGSPFESLMRITYPEGRVRLWLCRNRPRCAACRASAHHTRSPGARSPGARNPRARSPGG